MKKLVIRWGVGAAVAGATYLLLDALILEKYFFEVKTFNIGNEEGIKKIKLLHITDLHFKKRFWFFHRKLAKKINALNPDLIIITGDTLDTDGKLRPADQFLSLINHSFKKVAILGNHDRMVDTHIADLKRVYEKHNCILLINES